jgi:hypothetical protein
MSTSASSAGTDPLSERDRAILAFAAAHRLIVEDQVQALLTTVEGARLEQVTRLAHRRLRALLGAGLLSHRPAFHALPTSYQITRRGLAAIGSGLPVPRFETIRSHRHEIGVGWMWLSAHAGTFGPAELILSERELRGHDTAHADAPRAHEPGTRPLEARAEPPFGVALDAGGATGEPLVHYPDLMLVTKAGRVAIELALLARPPRRLQAIVAGYGADPKVADAAFFVAEPAVGKSIQAVAARLGLSRPTHVQPAEFGRTPPTTIAQ